MSDLPQTLEAAKRTINSLANNRNNLYFGDAVRNMAIGQKWDPHFTDDPAGRKDEAPDLKRPLSPITTAQGGLPFSDWNVDWGKIKAIDKKSTQVFAQKLAVATLAHYQSLAGRAQEQMATGDSDTYYPLVKFFAALIGEVRGKSCHGMAQETPGVTTEPSLHAEVDDDPPRRSAG